MSAKRYRMGRSSSSSGFNNFDWIKTVDIAPKTRPAPVLTWPVPAPSPVQKPVKSVVSVPVGEPRRCIFTVEPLGDCREREDEIRQDFYKVCSQCKAEILEDINVYMYGYLQAFCSLECRGARIEMDEKMKKPSPLRSQVKKRTVPAYK